MNFFLLFFFLLLAVSLTKQFTDVNTINYLTSLSTSSIFRSSSQCTPFTLNTTECSSLLKGRNLTYPILPGFPPDIFFDRFVALPISDVRMVYPKVCRRALVWYICSIGFPSCDASKNGPCSVDQNACEIVNHYCKGVISLNCTTLPPASQDCNGTSYLLATVDEPIPVVTCLSNLTTSIPCCPYPYVYDEESECIVECSFDPPYYFSSDASATVRYGFQILFYILVWLGFPFLIFVFVPLLHSFWKPFPHYVLPLALLFDYLYHQMIIWPMYTSDNEFYCGGIQDVMIAAQEFLSSPRCVIDAAFAFTFLILSDMYTLALAISIILQSLQSNKSTRSTENDLFLKYKQSSLIVHSIIWFIALSIFISIICVGFLDPITEYSQTLVISTSMGGYLHCYPGPSLDGYVFYFTWMIRTLIVGMSAVLLILSILIFRSWHILVLTQWRIIVFSIHHIIMQVVTDVQVYYYNDIWTKEVLFSGIEYPKCYAENARDPNPICPNDPLTGEWYLHVYFITRVLSVIAYCLYVYVANYHFRHWWWIILTQRRLPQQSDFSLSNTITRSTKTKSNMEESRSEKGMEAFENNDMKR